MLRCRSGGALVIGVTTVLMSVRVPPGWIGRRTAFGQQGPAEGRTPRQEDLPPRDAGPRKARTFVIHRGPVEWKTTQDFTVRPSELANRYANASGYLAKQTVDIGDRVTKGEVLAEINALELTMAVRRAEADLDLAEAQAKQAEARIRSAEAARRAVDASVRQAEADAEKYAAERKFREKEYDRIAGLARANAVEPKLVDEDRIRPGMTGRATIVLEPPHDAIVIPVSAIFLDDGVTSCLPIENGRAVRAKVTIGAAALQQAEILDGLKEGDVVALEAQGLRDGQRIEVAPSGDETTKTRR